MKRLLTLGILLLCWGARGATYTAASASVTDVQNAINNAQVVDGDTINVPSSGGIMTWGQNLSITKAINLIGAGTNASGTIVRSSAGGPLILWRPTSDKPIRLSGFYFNNNVTDKEIVLIYGKCSAARVDHCRWYYGDKCLVFNSDSYLGVSPPYNPSGIGVATGRIWGVTDHCAFINCQQALYVNDHESTDGSYGNGQFGSTEWGCDGLGVSLTPCDPTHNLQPGTTNMMVIENCEFTLNSSMVVNVGDPTIIYGQGGGTRCFRSCVFNGATGYIDQHGDNPDNGVKFYEVYSNVFNFGANDELQTPQFRDAYANNRGGMAMYHDNIFQGADGYSRVFIISQYWPDNPTYPNLTPTNIYWWNNTWNGNTDPSVQVALKQQATAAPTYNSHIILNRNYFLHAPQPGNNYYPYNQLVYPHPLVSPSAPSTNPVTSVSPSQLAWVMNPSSGTSNKTFTVQNTGQGTLSGSVALANAGGAFAFSGGTTYSLTSNQSSTITVTYTAPAGVTTISSNAVIFTDNGGGATGIVQGNAPRTYVWALGDSLTQGHDVNGGYRLPLYNLLTNNGVNAWFVGNANDNSTNLTPACVWHDGYGGYEITNGVNSGLAENVNSWFGNLGATPNYILLMIGFNDYRLNDRTATATNRLESLIVRLTTLAPSATIFVADLNPWVNLATTNNTMETYYNPYIPSIVARQVGLGRNVKLADMRGKLAPTDLESDNTHPTQNGYNIIATNWFAAIQGTPTPPSVVTQPVGVTNFYGSTLNLSVVASGSPTLSYQWRLNTNAIGGASSANYTKSNVSTNDQGWYDVLIANSYGSTSSIPVYVSLSANPNVPPGLVSSGSTGAAASWNSLVLAPPVNSSGANRMLLYYGYTYDAAGDTVTNVTFNGSEQFTELANTNYYDSFGDIHLWYLLNPSLTTANVLVNGNFLDEVAGRVMLVTNVNQSSPFEAVSMSFVQNGSPVTSDTLTPTQTTNELVIDALVSSGALWSPSATLIGNINAPNGTFFSDSQALGTSPATSMSWNGASDMISHIAVAIKPAAGAPVVPPGVKVVIHGKMSIRGKGSIR